MQQYDVGDIKAMVDDTERRLVDYRKNAEAVEKMWALQPFEDLPDTYLHQDGVEAIATADPYNIIQLLLRFVAGEPRIEVPYISATEEDDRRSQKLEQFLTAYWAQLRRQAGRNLMQDGAWYSGVRGRGVLETLWTGFEMPDRARDAGMTPITTRFLDPLNCGFCYGPWGTEYAFHRYDATRNYIRQAYPDYELDEADPRRNGYRSQKKYKVTSMWIAERDAIIHCVLIDDKFAKPATKTKYRTIPMIEYMGDGAPIEDEAARSLSLLHPLKDLWPAKSRLVSRMSTMFLYYAEPIYTANNPKDQPWKQPLTIKPGAVFETTGDQKLDVIRADANIPMATTLLQILDSQIQQATFPAVMYGEEGGANSGYAINQLASSARGRINTIRMNLESAIERNNENVLSLVEIFGGEEGITVMAAGNQMGDRGRPLRIKASDIQGNYANSVILVPEIPTDETQRLMTWSQLVDKGLVSEQFFRDRIVNIPVPRDEDLRITIERAYKAMPELQQKTFLAAMRERYKKGDQWRRIIAGTPLDALNQQEEQWIEQRAAEKEAAKQAKKAAADQEEQAAAMEKYLVSGQVPKGWHQMPGPGGAPSLMRDGEMQGNGTPAMMPPGMPLDLGMPPPGLAPGLSGGPSLIPGGGLPLEGPMMGPGMQPPGLPGQPPLPLGLPPEDGAQLTPEMMGVPPGAQGPGGGPPGMFQAMQGEPLTDEEIARRLLGAMGGGPPPQR